MPYQLGSRWSGKLGGGCGGGGVDGFGVSMWLGVAPSLGSLGLGGLVVVVGGGWVAGGDRAIGRDGFQCDSCVTESLC